MEDVGRHGGDGIGAGRRQLAGFRHSGLGHLSGQKHPGGLEDHSHGGCRQRGRSPWTKMPTIFSVLSSSGFGPVPAAALQALLMLGVAVLVYRIWRLNGTLAVRGAALVLGALLPAALPVHLRFRPPGPAPGLDRLGRPRPGLLTPGEMAVAARLAHPHAGGDYRRQDQPAPHPPDIAPAHVPGVEALRPGGTCRRRANGKQPRGALAQMTSRPGEEFVPGAAGEIFLVSYTMFVL